MQGFNLTKDEREELEAFQKWLRSLSHDQLLDAMSFPFFVQHNTHTATSTATATSASSHGGSSISGSDSNFHAHSSCDPQTTTSHEYGLLLQMLASQSPLPTPIHPKCGFKNDGKNEFHRVMKNRRIRPRLFQFLDQEGEGGGLSLPPEIASMVKSKAKAKLERRRMGGSGLVMERHRQHQHHTSTTRYQVIARKFTTPCGQVLSVGSTQQMRDADEQIVMHTYIQSGCRLIDVSEKNQGTIWCTFRNGGAGAGSTGPKGADDNNNNNNNNDENHLLYDSGDNNVLKKSHDIGNASARASASMDIVRMLKVVSRGRAFQYPPPPAPAGPPKNNNNNKHKKSANSKFSTTNMFIFAPWFHPTQEWFSLSTYLANRFEVALWNSFRSGMYTEEKETDADGGADAQTKVRWDSMRRTTEKRISRNGTDTMLNRDRTMVEETFGRLPPNILKQCLESALAGALKRVFMNQHGRDDMLNQARTTQGNTRDIFLYQLLLQNETYKRMKLLDEGGHLSIPPLHDYDYDLVSGFLSHSYNHLSIIPIVLLQSPIDKFRLLLIEQCELYISKRAEDELLVQVVENNLTLSSVGNGNGKNGTDVSSSLHSPSCNKSGGSVGSGKNKSKKRKKKKKKRRINGLASIDENKKAGNTEADRDGPGPGPEEQQQQHPIIKSTVTDRDMSTSPSKEEQEKNKNTILVLSGGKCLVTNPQSLDHDDESNDGFLQTVPAHKHKPPVKKTKQEERKYILKRPTKKPPPKTRLKPIPMSMSMPTPKASPTTQMRMRPIAKPNRSREDDVNLSLSPAYHHSQPLVYDNQMTMKRSNLTSTTSIHSHSIWNANANYSFRQQPMSSIDPDDSGVRNIHPSSIEEESTAAAVLSTMNFAPAHSSSNYQRDFSRIFTPIWIPNAHDSSGNDHVGLPLNNNDNDFLNEIRPYDGIFSHFFNDSTGNHDANFASSTVASIASSVLDNDDNSSLEASSEEDQGQEEVFQKFNHHPAHNDVEEEVLSLIEADNAVEGISDTKVGKEEISTNMGGSAEKSRLHGQDESKSVDNTLKSPGKKEEEVVDETFPEAPATPPAQLSPILVSLADIGEMKRRATFQNIGDIKSEGREGSSWGDSQQPSLTSLPVPKRSFSREDLRISHTANDDRRNRGPLCSSRTVDFSALSYRNAALKNATTRARSVSSHDFAANTKLFRPKMRKSSNIKAFPREIKEVIIDGSINLDVCAQSESALDDHEDSSHWNVIPKIGFDENDNATATRDGATTISSIPAPHEMDELNYLREERDSYRDMCLTMAAEISKLKNMLALERINSNYPTPQTATPFGSEYIPSFYHNRQQSSVKRYAAMSDAGLNEVQVPMSEDGTDNLPASVTTTEKGRRHISRTSSLSGTRIPSANVPKTDGSDIASLDYDNTTFSVAPTIPNYTYNYSGSTSHNLHQSRLSREIDYFLNSVKTKIQNEEKRRSVAITRLTTLVKTIWPRAQVLIYGSHQTDLRLPSSDLDFVICLPNVHKNAPADAPGALEGRNAVNESNQKLLARKLKSESWIEPRSIKIIERTLIPVIKVSTKDTRSRSLQLDISFDSPGHHGLESGDMVLRTMEKFPMIRPIVLVLKQFLLNKGLLTAYTGGLSSHCLFLMTTRYIQEQKTWVDIGSLLLGCLDFYGNSFDPRLFGISVSDGGQYFRRPHYQSNEESSQFQPRQTLAKNGLNRRHSFQHHDDVISTKRPADASSRPFTFDPLFVEDPISLGNNVGRNSFRINQVQRAFSDAHRAIAASLEWDLNSGSEIQDEYYPLLKSLLSDF